MDLAELPALPDFRLSLRPGIQAIDRCNAASLSGPPAYRASTGDVGLAPNSRCRRSHWPQASLTKVIWPRHFRQMLGMTPTIPLVATLVPSAQHARSNGFSGGGAMRSGINGPCVLPRATTGMTRVMAGPVPPAIGTMHSLQVQYLVQPDSRRASREAITERSISEADSREFCGVDAIRANQHSGVGRVSRTAAVNR